MSALMGYHLGAAQGGSKKLAVEIPVPGTTADNYLVSVDVLRKIQTLVVLALENQHTLSPQLREAVEDLAGSTKHLRQQIQDLNRKSVQSLPAPESAAQASVVSCSSPTTKPARCSTMAEKCVSRTDGQARSKLRGDEFYRLTSDTRETADDMVQLNKQRRKYEVEQTIYRWYEHDDGHSIAPASCVRCHDLGVQGVSFFWPESPDFDRLIIALGTDENPTYMAAEVVNSKAVVMHNAACYLVGCRFTSRVPAFSEAGREKFNERMTAPERIAMAQ
jgi:hypothetical protein